MSVLIETSLGDIVIDLFYEKCPLACTNFIKLCKLKFYNHSIFHMVEKDYLAKVTHIRTPSTSLNEILYGNQAQYFEDEINKDQKFNKIGLVATANNGPNMNNSDVKFEIIIYVDQFFITLTEDPLPMLEEKHTIFGIIAEGLDTLSKINLSLVDDQLHRPFKNIRIHHTLLLSDPFKDPETLNVPSRSPSLHREKEQDDRIEYGEAGEKELEGKRTEEEIIMATKEHQSKTRAIVLSMLNDIPDPDIKPPDNVLYFCIIIRALQVLFVCKLNPVTSEKDLELIFSRFGEIKACEVIRDWKTGNSLQYSFIEFETDAACEEAYFKMENTLIDERRIHVDFSQSVAKLWNKYRHRKYNAKGLGPEGQIGRSANDGLKIVELKTSIRPDQKNFKMVFDEEPQPTHHFQNEEKPQVLQEETKNSDKDKIKNKRRSRSRERRQHNKQYDVHQQSKTIKESNKQGKDKKRKKSKSSSPNSSSSSKSSIISYKSQSSSSLNSSGSNSKSRSHSRKKKQNQNKKKH